MNIIVCLDDAGGMMFNRRRQSRDRAVTGDILEICGAQPLWIHPYSEKLFKEHTHDLRVDEHFLSKAAAGAYCFVENVPLTDVEDAIEKIIVYRWNRRYPSDQKIDIDFARWYPEDTKEFAGYSHEKITRTSYRQAKHD